EEQGHRIAPDDEELFVQYRSEPSKRNFHGFLLLFVVSATNTSSSDGAIGRTSAFGMPAFFSSDRIVSSDMSLSTSKCMDCPNTVAVRTPLSRRTACNPTVTW